MGEHMDGKLEDKERVELIRRCVEMAYPHVRRADDPRILGDVFIGYDNYMNGLEYELLKLAKHGVASQAYLVEKLTSMKRRHQNAILHLDFAIKLARGEG
jgi:hypothetical protein